MHTATSKDIYKNDSYSHSDTLKTYELHKDTHTHINILHMDTNKNQELHNRSCSRSVSTLPVLVSSGLSGECFWGSWSSVVLSDAVLELYVVLTPFGLNFGALFNGPLGCMLGPLGGLLAAIWAS